MSASSKISINSQKQNFSLFNIWVAGFILKILLFTSYHSTDFDVHRNWLAITNRLPLKQWYYENTSQWTLDYPPFFAYFEFALSLLVPQIVRDDGCLDIIEVGQYGIPTIVFQRLTVIFSEIFLFLMLQWYINTSTESSKKQTFVVASSIALSPGFLIIDHIHFQYNGFLFAFIVGSIICVKLQKPLLVAAFFATALCFKHIFLYLAPAYFVYLLRVYCLNLTNVKNVIDLFNVLFSNEMLITKPWKLIRWGNLFKLGSLVILIFALAFAPFYDQIPQVVFRLFPFSRGLTHAYWAPNVWAIYSFSDRILSQVSLKLPIFSHFMVKVVNFKNFDRATILRKIDSAGNTKGLVQDVFFTILPNIPPKITFLLTLFYQIIALFPLFINPTYRRFLGALTLCAFASFLFGWHVHEKAIMLIIIPFSFLVIYDKRFLLSFNVLASSGYVSLFPLLFNSELWLLKVTYTLVWFLIYYASFKEVSNISSSVSRRVFFLNRFTLVYIVGLVPMVLTCGVLDMLGDKAGALGRMQFLRLMIHSVYCSVGVIGSWTGLSWLYFYDEPLWV